MDCHPPVSSVHGIPRQEYWSGLPFPTPEDLPNPGIKPASPTAPALQANSLPLSHLGLALYIIISFKQSKISNKHKLLKNTKFKMPQNYKNKCKEINLGIGLIIYLGGENRGNMGKII